MIALISPAKTMQSTALLGISSKYCTQPRFLEQTNYIAAIMAQYSVEELSDIFKIRTPMASNLSSRFQRITENSHPLLSAIDSYDGVVYKHFKDNINEKYIQEHVRISSLLYGLLRPLDVIAPYRMEGFVHLAGSDQRVDKYWRDIQTQTLIDDVNKAGGTLLYLASKEEQNSFHWKEVVKKARVIDFKFLQYKADKLRQVVVYTKMARGEMIRYMSLNNITNPENLKDFEWGGYRYNDTLSSENEWVWVMD